MGNMPSRLPSFACIVVAVAGSQILPGTRASLHGDAISRSDIHVVLTPPEESTQEVKESLDAIMRLEDVKRAAEETSFDATKQHIVSAERRSIRDLVRQALSK